MIVVCHTYGTNENEICILHMVYLLLGGMNPVKDCSTGVPTFQQ